MGHTWWSFVTYAPKGSKDVIRKTITNTGTVPGLLSITFSQFVSSLKTAILSNMFMKCNIF